MPAKKTRPRPLPIDPQYKTFKRAPAGTSLEHSAERKTQNHQKPGAINFTRKESENRENKHLGPLTINTDQRSDFDIEQIIGDAQQSRHDLHISDINVKVTYNTFEKVDESDLASNLSSSTEIKKEIENVEETNLRRSKRLPKINSIVKLNNPIIQTDYRKQRKTPQPVTTTGVSECNAGAGQRRKLVSRSHHKTNHSTEARHADHGSPDTSPTGRGRHTSQPATTAIGTATELHWILLIKLQRWK